MKKRVAIVTLICLISLVYIAGVQVEPNSIAGDVLPWM